MGSGPPVLLLHGGFSQRRVFGYQVLSLSRRHRVIAVDLPGHGGSSWDPSGPWFDQAVDGVIELVQEMDLSAPTIVGWSLGASVARGVSTRLGDARAVLVGAPAKPLDEETKETVRRYLLRDFPRYARSVVRMFTYGPTSPETEEWLFQMAIGNPLDAVVASLLEEGPSLPKHSPDAVAIHGAHDQVVPWDDRFQGAGRELVFERSGHAPFLEERRRFEELVSELAER